MAEIGEKLIDALSMFWQSLDEREQRLVVVGGLWLLVSLVSIPLQRRERERAEEQLTQRVAARLIEASRG